MESLGEKPETVARKTTGEQPAKPVIVDPEGRGVCEVCRGGACELPEHKPPQRHD